VWFVVILAADLIARELATAERDWPTHVAFIVDFAGSIAVAVAWHRAILLGERASDLGAMRFGRREWRFFGLSLVVAALVGLCVVAVVVLLQIAGVSFDEGPALDLLIAGSIVGLYLFESRVLVAFPIVAIDGPRGALYEAWNLTARAWPRIFACLLLVNLPFEMQWPISELLPVLSGTFWNLVIAAWDAFTSLLMAAVLATLASHVYARLAERPVAAQAH
jgi:hypothetical protein